MSKYSCELWGGIGQVDDEGELHETLSAFMQNLPRNTLLCEHWKLDYGDGPLLLPPDFSTVFPSASRVIISTVHQLHASHLYPLSGCIELRHLCLASWHTKYSKTIMLLACTCISKLQVLQLHIHDCTDIKRMGKTIKNVQNELRRWGREVEISLYDDPRGY